MIDPPTMTLLLREGVVKDLAPATDGLAGRQRPGVAERPEGGVERVVEGALADLVDGLRDRGGLVGPIGHRRAQACSPVIPRRVRGSTTT